MVLIITKFIEKRSSKSGNMNGIEYVELENLRNKVKELENDKEQLLRFCNPEYFKRLWVDGFVARQYCESQNGKCNHICDHVIVQTMDELWEQCRHNLFVEEMEELGLEVVDEYLSELKGE